MVSMASGFYRLGGGIYYGAYPAEHVSGRWNMAATSAKMRRTDVPFADGDWAACLQDNHAPTQQELEELPRALNTLLRCLGVPEGEGAADFTQTERRLGVSLPEELKILCRALSRTELPPLNGEGFLPLAQMYIDGDYLVFYKIRRRPAGLSLKDGTLAWYDKKAWQYSPGDENFVNYVLDRLAVLAIGQMPAIRKGRIRGPLCSTLHPEEELAKIFGEKLRVLEEYRNYGNILLVHEDGAIGFFRQNGFYADILLGCRSREILDGLPASGLDAVWS